MSDATETEATYRIDPVLAPFVKLLGYSIVFAGVSAVLTVPTILSNLDQVKQHPYWPEFVSVLKLSPLLGLMFALLLVMVWMHPSLLFVEVENSDD